MKEWTKDVEIQAPIDLVWQYFNGNLEDIQKIMPNVVGNELIKETENGVGSVYRQKYREGKRVQEYDVETLEYQNEEDYKKLKTRFNLANAFEISTSYELKKLDEHTTYFRYTTTNQPLKWLLKIIVKLGNGDKVVEQFVERVKRIAEADDSE